MSGVNKGFGQWAGARQVSFRILNTAGTPSIDQVFPPAASGDISVVDTGTGDFAVTIKNFKGPTGVCKVLATVETISMFASCASKTYSGNDVELVIKVENDASTASDASVDVLAIAY